MKYFVKNIALAGIMLTATGTGRAFLSGKLLQKSVAYCENVLQMSLKTCIKTVQNHKKISSSLGLFGLGLAYTQRTKIYNAISFFLDRNHTQFSRGKGTYTDIGKDAEKSTQRRDWYSFSQYFTELPETLSNIPLILVGLYHKAHGVTFAGSASFLYHMTSKQETLVLDRIGVITAVANVLWKQRAILPNHKLLISLFVAGTVGINAVDEYLARVRKISWLHNIWHCYAAGVAHILLSLKK